MRLFQIFSFLFSVLIIKYKDETDGSGFSSDEQNAGDASAKLVLLLLCYLANAFRRFYFIWPQFRVELFFTHFHKVVHLQSIPGKISHSDKLFSVG